MFFANDFDYDVVIVGGGISGLIAALNIIQRDPLLGVLVLEANDTVGGRTKPVPMETGSGGSSKVILDSGGHFVCRRQSHLLALLNRLGIDIADYNFPGYTLTESKPDHFIKSDGALLLLGTDMDKDELTCFYQKLEQLCITVSLENPMGSIDSDYLDSLTMDEYINLHIETKEARQLLRNMVRTTCGSEASDISPLFYLSFCNSTGGLLAPHLRQFNCGRSAYIKGGVPNLVEKLVAELGEQRIFVDSPVTKIIRSERDVIVYTVNENYKCRCAILALPPRQLLKIKFDPPLYQAKLQALQQMKGKSWLKFLATYKEAFWQRGSLSGDVFVIPEAQQCPIVIVLNVSTEDTAALTGLVDPKRLRSAKNYDVEILRQLAEYLGPEALEPLDYVERLWPGCETEGAMCSNPRPGAMRIFHEVRRPIGRLYFAGSETATYWYGHIAGAVQAGLRAALEVLYEIRPQVLSYQDFAELKPRRRVVSFYQEIISPPPAQSAGWLGRVANGVREAVRGYLVADTILSTYRGWFGPGRNNSNGGAGTT